MDLPERAAPFLGRLSDFASAPPLASFRTEASRAYFGDDRLPNGDELPDYSDYLVHGHRDPHGRGLIDLFLEARSASLPAPELEAFQRLRDSTFGFFAVESVRRGESVEMRLAGTQQRFHVVENAASRTLHGGMGLLGRIVPYRDHHEFTNLVQVFPPQVVYLVERLLRRAGESQAALLRDPRTARKLLASQRSPPRARNAFEAGLFAAQVFAELKIPLSVSQVQKRFQRLSGPLALLHELQVSFSSIAALDRLMQALQDLWNHTPRDELGGLTPARRSEELRPGGRPELPQHLASDFFTEAAFKLNLGAFPDDASRARAVSQLFDAWIDTPQTELGGRTPRDFLGSGEIPPLPSEAELPPAGEPAWAAERLLGLVRDRERPRAAVWALGRLAARLEDLPLDALSPLLDHTDPELARRTLEALRNRVDSSRETASETPAEGLRRLVTERLESFATRGEWVLLAALRLLGRLGGSEVPPGLVSLLASPSSEIREAAVDVLAARRGPQAAGHLREVALMARCPRLILVAIHGLAFGGDVEAVAAAARRLLRILKNETGDLPFDLAYVVLADADYSDLPMRAEDSLFPDPDEPAEEERHALFSPMTDPGAARRAAACLLSVERERILRLADLGDLAGAASFLAPRVCCALDMLAREEPEDALLCRALSALVEATSAGEAFGGLGEGHQRSFLTFYVTLLARAIRGAIDPSAPARRCATRPAQAIRLDDDWLDTRSAQRLAELLPADELAGLTRSPEPWVRRNSFWVLAVKDPDRWFLPALEGCEGRTYPESRLVAILAAARGDAVLPLIAARLEEPHEPAPLHLAQVIERLGTRRAAFYLGRYLPLIASACRAGHVVHLGLSSGDPRLAKDILDRLRAGFADVGSAARLESMRRDLVHDVGTLLEVYELPGVAPGDEARIVAEGIERAAAAGRHLSMPGGRVDGGWEDDDFDFGGDDLLGLGFPEDPFFPGAGPSTLRRQEPKVGRNDPCPCGSGKKYKKCCGKET